MSSVALVLAAQAVLVICDVSMCTHSGTLLATLSRETINQCQQRSAQDGHR